MIYKWDLTIPQLSGEAKRRGYVALPERYDLEPQRRYPVLYMFDGHNVFFDEDATYGKSWGMKEYLEREKPELIIVAVECNSQGYRRLEEYTPIPFSYNGMQFEARGKIYMDWLTGTLKPAIDARLRTLPDPANTCIGGSSMGGLMSLYGVTAYNHIFRRAACLSPSLWVSAEQSAAMIRQASLAPGTNIYMDYGSKELAHHPVVPEALHRAAAVLLEKGVDMTLRIVPGGTHCEASWEKQIPIFMQCLGLI